MKATSTSHLSAEAHVQFTDIGPDDPRLATDILPVLGELRPHLTSQSLKAIYAEGHSQGLRFTRPTVHLHGRAVQAASPLSPPRSS